MYIFNFQINSSLQNGNCFVRGVPLMISICQTVHVYSYSDNFVFADISLDLDRFKITKYEFNCNMKNSLLLYVE